MNKNFAGTSYPHILITLVLLLSATFAIAQEDTGASLSIGAINDRVEGAAVRVLAKYGESLGVTDRLVPKGISDDRKSASFYTLSRQVTVDTTDKGSFGGASFRYGVKLYNVGMKTETKDENGNPLLDENGKPTTITKFDGDKRAHIFPINIGADTDRNFNNHDYLVEAGYIPAQFRYGDSCFKLGANPIVGLSVQLGHRQRTAVSTASGQPPEPSGNLRRLKLEGKLDFPLSCIFNTPSNANNTSTDALGLVFADIGQWQVIASSTGWRDYVESRTYQKHELTVRIPTGTKTSFDLKREIGAAPANFDTGAKFSANMTIEF